MLVDTQGCLLAVLVLAADISDRDGALLLLALCHARYPALRQLWGDSHYGGSLPEEAQTQYGIDVAVVKKPADQEGFVPLPKRWIVERTLAWLGGFRRLAKDFEIVTATAENMIRIAMLKITLDKCI